MMARCAPLLLAMASSTFLRPPAHAGGEPCLFTCEEGECIDFVCQPCDDCQPPPAVQCASDAECHYWEHCLDGVCENKPLPECGAVVPCPAGELCIEGQCLSSSGLPCVSQRECPAGESCLDGVCVLPDPGGCDGQRPCPDGEECVDGRCQPQVECTSDVHCRTGRCEDGRCVPRFYDPPGLVPLTLPDPPTERDREDDPPVWNLPDDDDPFGNISPEPPEVCDADALGDLRCCSHVTGWSFEVDEVDEHGTSTYEPWTSSGPAFGRGPVYGNNVHIDRIMPPGYTNDPKYGPADNVGGDYWAFSRDVNQKGKWWIGSSDVRPSPKVQPGGRQPEHATGWLRSPRIIIDSDYIRFYVGGRPYPTQRVQLEIFAPDPASKAELAALYDGIGVSEMVAYGAALPIPSTDPKYVVVRASGPKDAQEFMHRRVVWNVSDFKGKKARIAIVDGKSWGALADVPRMYINVDEVICTDELDDDPSWATIPATGELAKVGEALTPIPLWGTTDTHTHPFVNLAFGGDLVWGDPHDELIDVYSCTGSLAEISEGGELLRPEKHQRSAEGCGTSDILTWMVSTVPCETLLGIPVVGVALNSTCNEMRWDVADVLMNKDLVEMVSLHGSVSGLSGGVDITGVREVVQEITPFMNTCGTIFTEVDLPDFGQVEEDLPDHVPGLVERLAWDTDDGRHSRHGIKGHQLYQKDMIRRAYHGGLRLIGLDVIDSRTITKTLDLDADYDEWRVIRSTVLSARHLVSCGDDPLFPNPGPLCDIAGIAHSPQDVRELVGQDKLAIVLGSEVDELGVMREADTMALFGHPDDDPETDDETDSIELQIADLHALGIRKVTAIHALNNPLGGAGIFNDTYLSGNNELANVLDPESVDRGVEVFPWFIAGNFTEEMCSLRIRATDPDQSCCWDGWDQEGGGWVWLDLTQPWEDEGDWIGDGITFEYGFPSVATPLGFPATMDNLKDDEHLFPTPAFMSKGTWSGVNEVYFPWGFDQLLEGGEMCGLDGAGLPLGVNAAFVPPTVQQNYREALMYGNGYANNVGLRPMGEVAIRELMKRGMIIDLDHFSQRARLDTWAIAQELGDTVFEDGERLYPTFGVHTNSRVHERHGPFPDFHDLREERGYTAETDRGREEFERSRIDGGAFSPGANAGYMTDHPEHEEQVRNDCDYSAKSFAHRYLWMMKAMEGRGLTPSTDMSPFFTAAAPRFGQHQCHLRTAFHDDMIGLETAKDEDENPLESPHWCPFWDYPDKDPLKILPPNECKSHQFPHDWIPDEPGKEICRIWGKDFSFCTTYQNLQQQLAEGAGVWYADYAGRELPDVLQPVQPPGNPQVTYVVARRADEERDDAAPRAEIDEIVAIGGARQIWPMKKMKTTAGYQLDPAKNTGWDVNLDGFPHIGLFPDFLQDVRNVGVSWERMSPLFNAVEDYVRMWERSCELANRWAEKDATTPGCEAP